MSRWHLVSTNWFNDLDALLLCFLFCSLTIAVGSAACPALEIWGDGARPSFRGVEEAED